MAESKNEVTICSLSDKKLSVRVNGEEITILPNRKEATLDALQSAFQKVVDSIGLDDEDDPEEW